MPDPGRPLGDGLDEGALEAAAEAMHPASFGDFRDAGCLCYDNARKAISTYLRLTSTPTSNASGEGEGNEKVNAPWTMEQVEALNTYQADGSFHPYTCVHSSHGSLIATVHGWVCINCDYRQDWAHAFTIASTAAIPTPETETTSMAASAPQKMVDPYGPPSATIGEDE